MEPLDLVPWIRIEVQSWIRFRIETNVDPKYSVFSSFFIGKRIDSMKITFEKSIALVLQVCGTRWNLQIAFI
jgi:hypothetical protein